MVSSSVCAKVHLNKWFRHISRFIFILFVVSRFLATIKILRFYNVFGVVASENYLARSGELYFLYNKNNVYHLTRDFSKFILNRKLKKYRFYNFYWGSWGVRRPSGGRPAALRRSPFEKQKIETTTGFIRFSLFCAPEVFYQFSVISWKGEHNYIEKRWANWLSAFIYK
jgi:hypothetical protein